MDNYQPLFASGLLNPDVKTPEGVIALPRDGKPKAADKRYNVYRNNVTSSLIEALAKIFPATQRIVGEQFFRDMARVFVRTHPPQSPLILEFGHEFEAFVRAFEHTQNLPYLPDVIAIERAWLSSYHAANAPVLAADALSSVPPEQLGDIRFEKHPAAYIKRSPFPAVAIFAANRAGTEMPKRALNQAEDALIVRPALEVLVLDLPKGHALFLQSLFEGVTLGEAANITAEAEPEFDISSAITGILQSGAFTKILITNT